MADRNTVETTFATSWPKIRTAISTAGLESALADFQAYVNLGTDAGYRQAVDFVVNRGYSVTTDDVPPDHLTPFKGFVQRECRYTNPDYAGVLINTGAAGGFYP